MDMDPIWSYYLRAAEVTGAEDSGEEDPAGQSPFSVRRFFSDSPAGENALVRAYLGDREAMDALPWVEGRALEAALEPRLDDALVNKRLNRSQRQAILHALTSPLTIIQGPPGTGKTETICNLLACIHALYPERTAAMVSSNNAAVDNVAEKLMKWESGGGIRERELWNAFSYLGSRQRREAWLTELGLEKPNRAWQLSPEYLEGRPLFTSTIHSLKRCFSPVPQFDYVIVDECSQVSCLLGLIAMGCARRLVLLGDPMQLPAVITDRHEAAAAEFPDLDPVYADRQGYSFLEACRSLFPRAPFVLLNEHYRCHPVIAGFFNRYYGGRLVLPPVPPGAECPIHIRWYEGDYWEVQGRRKIPQQGRTFFGLDRRSCRVLYALRETEEGAMRAAYVNERQIAVFLREEWPELQRRMAAEPGLTACVLSPYVYQLHRLRQELRRLGRETTLTEGDEEENTLPRLTIHEAQGKEFDLVYYLPVEDVGRSAEWPRSQETRMVNVALSRAVREFRIIVSAQWLPEEFQQRELGYALELRHPPDGDRESRLQLSALIRYALEHGAEPVRSGIVSIFDRIPLLRQERGGEAGDPDDSAPARCLMQALEDLARRPGVPRFRVLREVPLKALVPPEMQRAEGEEEAELLRFLTDTDTRADFVLRRPGLAPLVIEVDGSYHRSSPDQAERDRKKDAWLERAFGAGGFLRLPTDGTSENEEERIRRIMDERRAPAPEQNWADRKEQLMEQLRTTIADCARKLEEQCRTEEGYDTELLNRLADNNDYRNAEEGQFNYGRDLDNALYYCRFGAAYAYEYAQLYREILKDYLRNGANESMLGVYSLGCGSLLDAWSMAYARADLACAPDLTEREREICGNLKLLWKGADREDWPVKIFTPKKINGTYTPMEQRDAAIGTITQLDLTWGDQGDVVEFLRTQEQLDHNIFMFPKILNELPPQVVDGLVQALTGAGLRREQYYICISHSISRVNAGIAAAARLVKAFRERGYRAADVLAESASPVLREDMAPRTLEDCLAESASGLVNLLHSDFRLRNWIAEDPGSWEELTDAMDIEDAGCRLQAIRSAVAAALEADRVGPLFAFLLDRQPEETTQGFNRDLRQKYRMSCFTELLEIWSDPMGLPSLPPVYLARPDVTRYIYDRDPDFRSPELMAARNLIHDLGIGTNIRETVITQNNVAFQLIRLDLDPDLQPPADEIPEA